MHKREKIFHKIIAAIFGIMMFLILTINIVVDHRVDYLCKNDIYFNNFVLLLMGLGLFIVIMFLYKKIIEKQIGKLNKKQCQYILIIGCFIMLLIQIYVSKRIFFLTGWDAGKLRNISISLSKGINLNDAGGDYLVLNPNNTFLTFIFTIICKIALKIGKNPEFLLTLGSVLSVNLSLYFITKCAGELTNNKNVCVFCFGIFSMYIALSPWNVIPYSDTYAMCFTTMILYSYLIKEKMNKNLSWFIIYVLSFVGYLVKPTVIIVLIAILILEIAHFLFCKKNKSLKDILKNSFIFLLSILTFLIVNSYSQKFIGYEGNKDYAKPMTHYLMMGLNSKTCGVFSSEDTTFTDSIIGKDNKINGNIKVIKTRLNKFGISGYLNFLKKKLLVIYNDGTFAWSVEGMFYEDTSITDENDFLKRYFYSSGDRYKLFVTCQQMTWITLILFIIISLKNTTNVNKKLHVILLTIVGITIFLLLFEARARYLLLYAPYYVLLASIGISNVHGDNRIKCLFKKVEKNNYI